MAARMQALAVAADRVLSEALKFALDRVQAWSIFESLAYNVRGEDDLLNPAGGAAGARLMRPRASSYA